MSFFYIYLNLCFPYSLMLIFVPSGDSSGISVTGETPQERGFRDEEAHRTPHGKRPLGTKISADQDFLFHQRHLIRNQKKATQFNNWVAYILYYFFFERHITVSGSINLSTSWSNKRFFISRSAFCTGIL